MLITGLLDLGTSVNVRMFREEFRDKRKKRVKTRTCMCEGQMQRWKVRELGTKR